MIRIHPAPSTIPPVLLRALRPAGAAGTGETGPDEREFARTGPKQVL